MNMARSGISLHPPRGELQRAGCHSRRGATAFDRLLQGLAALRRQPRGSLSEVQLECRLTLTGTIALTGGTR
jgi:hypothetical protein